MNHLFVLSINFFHGYKNLKFFIKKIFYRLILISGLKPGFIGPFKTWELATASSVGYDSPVVLNMVRNAITNVLDGINLYERDGTAFNEYPSKNTLRAILRDYLSADSVVVDFGGGLVEHT